MTAGTVILIQNSQALGDSADSVLYGVAAFTFTLLAIYLLVRYYR